MVTSAHEGMHRIFLRERIITCTDLDRMDAWLERSRTVERAEDLFAEDHEGPETSSEEA